MERSQNFLATENVGRLMQKYAVPCVISLLVGALYNIVDQIFIANASYLGSYGNAANTVVFPLTVIALGIAVCFGDGCCAMVSGLLGEGKRDEAKHSVGNAILLTVAAGCVLMVLYLVFDDELITVFGGRVNAETFELSKEYFFYITLGIPFYMFGQAMNPVIRADGSPKFAMVSTLSGALANVILDPIFIFVFRLGMMGAVIDCTDVLRQLVGNYGGELFFISVPDCLFIVPAFEFQHIQSAVHPCDFLLHMRLLRFKQFFALWICGRPLFTPIHKLFDIPNLHSRLFQAFNDPECFNLRLTKLADAGYSLHVREKPLLVIIA